MVSPPAWKSYANTRAWNKTQTLIIATWLPTMKPTSRETITSHSQGSEKALVVNTSRKVTIFECWIFFHISTNTMHFVLTRRKPEKENIFCLAGNDISPLLPQKRAKRAILYIPCCCLVAKSSPALLGPHGLQPIRFLCPLDSPSKNAGVGWHFLLQRIFPTQGSNPSRLHWQADSLPWSYLGSPIYPLMRY